MKPAFLVIDKPVDVTSHDIVAAVRAVTGVRKVGHTGTLDPFATGVLALALGRSTRLVQYLDESIKVYDATLKLGRSTDTGDLTGETLEEAPVPALDAAWVDEVLAGFEGDQLQKPHPYSAVKYKGKPLYHYARRGETVDVPGRPITIHSIRRTGLEADTIRMEITCSRGTYARVIADDVAKALGTAGHLTALARTRSGPFTLERALTMAELGVMASAEPGRDWREVVLARGPSAERVPWRTRPEVREGIAPWLWTPLQALSGHALLEVDAATAARTRQGQAPPVHPAGVQPGERYLVVQGDDLVAVAELGPKGPSLLRVVTDDDPPRGRRGRRRRR